MTISASSWCLLLLLLCLPLMLIAHTRPLCVCPGCNQVNVDRRCRCCMRADTKRSVPDDTLYRSHYSQKPAASISMSSVSSMSSQPIASLIDSIIHTQGISLPANNTSQFVLPDGKPPARLDDNVDEKIFRDQIIKPFVTSRQRSLQAGVTSPGSGASFHRAETSESIFTDPGKVRHKPASDTRTMPSVVGQFNSVHLRLADSLYAAKTIVSVQTRSTVSSKPTRTVESVLSHNSLMKKTRQQPLSG